MICMCTAQEQCANCRLSEVCRMAAPEWPVVREDNVVIGQFTDPGTGATVDIYGTNLRSWCPQRDA